MNEVQEERLSAEIALLESMYPEQMYYNEKARELTYRSDNGSFHLRLPDGYPQNALPSVLSASQGKTDLREQLRQHIAKLEPGEEVLDEIILSFGELAERAALSSDATHPPDEKDPVKEDKSSTIIVWLHHLLNTNKRKQALSPSCSGVSGITKPGYPGVLIYSGPSKAVHEHVNELKGLNWAAFQVRLEEDELWTFSHGSGVSEVEAMKDVVAEVGDDRKGPFMEAMRMK
ncbi:hypothetical protein Tdes44962_MAKER02841 [Teratosphaeria destructans]|uniref:RWD domain-containing protein n=1 Tax=Teratosphaeria destructans TaxID=418781 RepID=A0A9W7SS43_9PEZI|nr:hypothetical protein Tdes44962_MAKER02841 [Teratosphaeria destructans]